MGGSLNLDPFEGPLLYIRVHILGGLTGTLFERTTELLTDMPGYHDEGFLESPSSSGPLYHKRKPYVYRQIGPASGDDGPVLNTCEGG